MPNLGQAALQLWAQIIVTVGLGSSQDPLQVMGRKR
jgi:hypothetical protein